jgi:hypothetical protein
MDRCVGLTTLPPSCADCLKIWKPQPPAALRACPGLYTNCFTLTFNFALWIERWVGPRADLVDLEKRIYFVPAEIRTPDRPASQSCHQTNYTESPQWCIKIENFRPISWANLAFPDRSRKLKMLTVQLRISRTVQMVTYSWSNEETLLI